MKLAKHKSSKKWSLVELKMELFENNCCFENVQTSILELYFYYVYLHKMILTHLFILSGYQLSYVHLTVISFHRIIFSISPHFHFLSMIKLILLHQ